jgi:hypothetical protein
MTMARKPRRPSPASVKAAADRAEMRAKGEEPEAPTGVLNPPETKKKVGRPQKYSAELAATICEHIAEGKSLRSFCEMDETPSKSMVMRWLREHAEFRDQYVRAREDQAELHAEEIVHIADTEPDPQVARVRIDARKWVAARLLPKRYGEKSEVNVNADHKHHHAVEPLSESAHWLEKLLGGGTDSEAPKSLPH